MLKPAGICFYSSSIVDQVRRSMLMLAGRMSLVSEDDLHEVGYE